VSGRPLTASEVAREELHVGRSTVPRLVATEGLPCFVLAVGPHGRRLIRFDRDEVREWLKGRAERKVSDWTRYQRREPA
jgi:excisionase family DNA binding protein